MYILYHSVWPRHNNTTSFLLVWKTAWWIFLPLISRSWLKVFGVSPVRFPKIQRMEQIANDGVNPAGHSLTGQQWDPVQEEGHECLSISPTAASSMTSPVCRSTPFLQEPFIQWNVKLLWPLGENEFCILFSSVIKITNVFLVASVRLNNDCICEGTI